MPADYLSYWKPATVARILEEESPLLVHAASEQYGRVAPRDTVWIVTTWPGGQLMLLGRIIVHLVTDHVTAARLLGTDDLWDATYHILAVPGLAEVARDVDLTDLAPALRFESRQRDRLDLSLSTKLGSQLQSMRHLTAGSASLLRQRWGEDFEYGAAVAQVRVVPEGQGGGYGDAASNREVEQAAVTRVSADLRAEGWQVESVEQQRIGYDLLCTRGDERRHVEVKGVRGTVTTFIITEGELLRAESDPDFWLYLVTDALGSSPRLDRLTGEALSRQFTLVPLAYRALPAAR